MNNVIIFPTDTVYGIGCSIYDKESQLEIYKIKHRDLNKPLAVLCASLEQIDKIAYLNDDAVKLINKFLPGPFTLILKAKEDIKKIMGIDTIGVRIPNHKLALSILSEIGPMTTTSVNESGEIPLNTYDEIYNVYKDKVKKIYQSNEPSSNLSSTVAKIIDDKIEILREGAITKEMIEDVLK